MIATVIVQPRTVKVTPKPAGSIVVKVEPRTVNVSPKPAGPGLIVKVQPPQMLNVTPRPAGIAVASSVAKVRITVAEVGPSGPQGPIGGFGVWDQPIASSTWLVAHNLGFFPEVTVVDSANRVVFGALTYVDPNNLRIDFSTPFAGRAYMS